ncbi:hypothetical protein [Cupriavidus sp. SS-3]|uniref:hypothetical protein n=1 Tax=Cupriavidus sp. SS-3 TaxID=3109596 RepID=UPI002DB852BB|nr:hypothetical protein [Cupriavidus sp. SS-3]MEC3769058.1 hypothetical protein [Cupriavidus sp. SS-3]
MISKPLPSIFAALAIGAFHHRRTGEGVDNVIQRMWPGAGVAIAAAKAAQNPADTTTPGWAAELMEDAVAEYAATALAGSLFTQLAALSVGVPVVRGRVRIPVRDFGKRLAAVWHVEGQPIPVSGAGLSTAPLLGGRVAVITVATNELMDAPALPTFEAIMAEDIQATVDAALVDDTQGSEASGRPSGLLYGATEVTSTGDAATDLAALLAAVPNLSTPVFVLPYTYLPAAAAAGALRDDSIFGLPYLATGATDSVILLDAADLLVGMSGAPDVAVSDAATLHMEDTVPLPIVDNAATPVVAHPVLSMWQQDMSAIRSLVPAVFHVRGAGRVAVLVPAP